VTDARTVLARCARLGECSEEPGLLVRRYATPALRAANDLVAGWMRDAGLRVHEDPAGNLIGRREAQQAGARALVLGSHLDSVRDAGRFDGPLGVLAGLAVVERLGERPLPFAVEVMAFADEEGTRYGTAFLGSSAVAGRWDPAWDALVDDDGVRLADALRAFGGDPARIAAAARDPAELLGYGELHIEQGPVLEARDAPLGVVTAITGQSNADVTFTGEAGHAGTVPMAARRDAFAAAAEWALAVESRARGAAGVVATVGSVAVGPGARNVVPGRALLSLDVRHGDDVVRRDVVAAMRAEAEEIAAARGVGVSWTSRGDTPAVPLDAALGERLAGAVAATGLPVERLPSGAGHDAAIMAGLTPAAMLFVRCRGGISHNPAESVEAADVAVALDALERFVVGLA
jgi:allantoate deiminase